MVKYKIPLGLAGGCVGLVFLALLVARAVHADYAALLIIGLAVAVFIAIVTAPPPTPPVWWVNAHAVTLSQSATGP
jgi:hypothetical protein